MGIRAFSNLHCGPCGGLTLHGVRGCVHCNPPPESKLAPTPERRRVKRRGRPKSIELSNREREVVKLLAEGLGASAICERLGIAGTSVSHYVYRACEKLSLTTREQLIERARAGLAP
jgi:DNA-binding CsgD family transcriptional regulator